MIIKTQAELDGMLAIGRICGNVLKRMGEAVKPGMTTKELDDICGQLFAEYGAVSAPIHFYKFPGQCCISVNDEVAHGIPGDRVIKAGDLVNIDISAVKDGFVGDTSATFAVPPVKVVNRKLMDAGKEALEAALNAAVAGKPMNGIGLAAQKVARRHGYKIVENLCGHGVGYTLHDKPEAVYNYYEKLDRRMLQHGMCIAIEPFLSLGDDYVEEEADGWTLKTPNRSQVVQYEHSVMVRDGEPPLILPLPDC